MKKSVQIISKAAFIAAAAIIAAPAIQTNAAEINGWGDTKLYIDPGHEGKSNQGIWGYSEAEKTLRVALNIKDMLETYTDMPAENLKLCRYTDQDVISLEERSDAANAWGADFYYSIHSDAGATVNSIVLLFGGWRKDGVEIEKTPNGGKRFGEFLDPNLAGVMRIPSRGNWYDRCFYDRAPETHTNQYPYLSVNRRSNMPSLLSEGGYHTIGFQQARNMNDDYKRLEAFAAFQALLKYFGLNLPKQTFMTGVISNSENGAGIDAATITVGDKTYTTDSYETLFSKFTKNPNLIHNGFYFFEGLEAGKEYPVTVEAAGFDPVSTTVTIKEGGEITPDFVTFLDVEMTNNAPAKVDGMSLTDLDNVSPLYPLVLTFSRNMDRESVEKAFSIDNGGQVALTWENDYTLSIDLSQLDALWQYTIKIDGSIAINSQTQQLLDGDGDGVAGGDYILVFTMAEPDTEPAEVVWTYPAAESEVVYTKRPPISIEFNELLDWNDDTFGSFVTVKDADGNILTGTLSHANINEHSVLTYLLDADLPTDKAILVSVEKGLVDLWGNLSSSYHFRFLSEYRTMTDETMVFPLTDLGSFWAPAGSGSSHGLDKEESVLTVLPVGPHKDLKSSMGIYYVFDESLDAPYLIRDHNPNTVTLKDVKGVITMWVYGDGSNNKTGLYMRNMSDSGLKYKKDEMVVNFRGWNLYHWDVKNDEFEHFTGTATKITKLTSDAIYISHEYTDPEDEDTPYQMPVSTIGYNSWAYSHWDDGERQAQIDDIELPAIEGGVEDLQGNAIAIAKHGDMVEVSADGKVLNTAIYNTSGAQVASANGAKVSIAHLTAGVYVVRATTAAGVATAKIVK